VSVLDEPMSVKHLWNDTGRENPKCRVKNASVSHFQLQNTHVMAWN